MTTAPSSAIGEFVIGQSPIQGSIGTPQTVQKTVLAYLYEQYADDPNLQAFVDAYNVLTQGYVDWFNQTNLPVYTGLSGPLLDWVGAGLYGFKRPVLTSGIARKIGPYNTFLFNQLPYNGHRTASSQNYVVTSDDVYKRCLTWNFYKGDGQYFTVNWLKRRVMRFLTGANGTSPNVDQTYPVSVEFVAPNEVTINVDSAQFDPNVFAALQEGIAGGVLQLPFQFTFAVTSGEAGFGFFAFGISAF